MLNSERRLGSGAPARQVSRKAHADSRITSVVPFAKAIIAPLTVALAAAFWARFIHRSLTGEGLFYYVGVDWGMFWAAAHAALGSGPKDVYNLHLLGQYVAPLRHYYGPQAAFLKVNPVPYPPIFIALFIPFTFVSPP